jgi:membrane-associated phospholipid phosphatase
LIANTLNDNNSEEDLNFYEVKNSDAIAAADNAIWLFLSKLISEILHPILVPSYFSAWVLFFSADIRFQGMLGYQLLGTIMVFTIVFPLFIIIGLKRLGFISSYAMENRTDRVLPFFFMATIYATCLYTLSSVLKLNMLLYSMVLSMNLSVLTAAVISMRVKISAHIISISGVLGFLLASANNQRDGALITPFVLVLILAGGLASARLYLNKHTPFQVILGAICGFVISFACTFVLLN